MKRDQFRHAVLSVAVVGVLVGSGTVVAGSASAAAAMPAGTATAAMRVTELPGLPGYPQTRPSDLNDRGVTVGQAMGDLGTRAVRWSRDGKVTELPGLGGSSAAIQINNRGAVVGYVSNPSGQQFPALWDASNRLTVLPSLPGYERSEANAINDNGTVVGAAYNGEWPPPHSPPYRPVQWDRRHRITELPLPSGYQSGAASLINKPGMIAGFVRGDNSEHWRAVRWDRKRNVRVLETLGGPASWVAGMNDRGDMVGRADWAPYRWGPVRWDRDGRVTELPFPEPGRYSGFAFKINEHGVAVGIRDLGPPDTAALRWDRAGRVTALRSISGGTGSAAIAISDRGIVVGNCLMSDYTSRPVMWLPDGRPAELPLPTGYQSGGASLVNNRGVIVGQGAGADQGEHALLWRPV